MPGESPIRHLVRPAARPVAAKRGVLRHDGRPAAVAYLHDPGAAQVVVVQVEEAVVGRVGVAADAHGRCLSRQAVACPVRL